MIITYDKQPNQIYQCQYKRDDGYWKCHGHMLEFNDNWFKKNHIDEEITLICFLILKQNEMTIRYFGRRSEMLFLPLGLKLD